MTSKAPTVAKFLAGLPPDKRKVLAGVRDVIRSVAPRIVETMNYGMPCYVLDGEPFCAFNAQKHYFSFYISPDVLTRYKADLKGANFGKCCIRFKSASQLPPAILRKMLLELRQAIRK